MWSRHNPRLQTVWDATSLRALQECPRRYQLSIQEGWRQREESEHLTFGGLFQEAVERFQLARLRGLGLETAGLEAMTFLVQASGTFLEEPGPDWDYTPDGGPHVSSAPTFFWQPWGGQYLTEWRCTGTEPYKNEKGNKAKCPASHKGKWFPVTYQDAIWQHEICGECGSPTETAERWKPEHPSKNRETLLRTFVAFWDAQDEEKGLQPFAFPDGTPAVELQVVVPMGRKEPGRPAWGVQDPEREDYLLVANVDEINTWRGRTYPTDNKTTKNTLNDRFFEGFSPDVQFDLYDLISTLVPGLDPGGVAVRGIQVTATGNDVKTALITKTEGQREELWRDLHWWIDLAERLAADGYYPMNRAHCKMCDFRPVCDMDPVFRAQHLEANFHRRPWNPITRNAPALAQATPSPQIGQTPDKGVTK